MNSTYKIVLSNLNFYKEIELTSDLKQIKVGTDIDCEIRLRKELFFERFELVFVNQSTGWTVVCSDNLYFSLGDIRKLSKKDLVHGDNIDVKYQNSDVSLFSIDFLINFDDGKKKYDRIIDVSSLGSFSIGSSNDNDIIIKSDYTKGDKIIFNRAENGFKLDIKKSTYGVYINGNKAKNGAKVRNMDFISISDFFFYYKDDKIWTDARDGIALSTLKYLDSYLSDTYPKFNRSTRIKTVINDEKIEVLAPPEKVQKPKNNIFMRLLPSLGMILASGVMAAYGGTRMIVMSVISAVMAIVTSVFGLMESNKEYKKNSAERIEKYNSYIDRKRSEITKSRDDERKELEEIYVSHQTEQKNLRSFSWKLFDRRADDEDFLCIRLGEGDIASKREINYKKQEKLEIEDELQKLPEKLYDEFKNVQNAPVVCDLKSVNSIGVVGTERHRFDLMKNMVIDIVARQYISDVKLFFVSTEKNKDKILWLRMLPQVYNNNLGVRNLVVDDESRNVIFEYLFKELNIREKAKTFDERIIIFFYDEFGFKSHPLSKFADKANELGVTFVFFGNEISDIPQGCGYIISIEDDSKAKLIKTDNRDETISFKYPIIKNKHAIDIVNLMAPVYTEEISLEGTLTKNISLFEMLNILAVDDIDLESRWAKSQVFRSMAAPLGVSKTGIVSLDLHDKAHGPHGLVAGTTGSGKSEILQTYILSMATLFHPYEVGFVIIDFKGGGMVNQFKDLPHLLGAITNIDGKEIDRSLKSIKAELQKRQRLFAEAEVNHIDKYIRKFKANEVSIPLPHLILIVDEFAELKAEQPEFMKELISAARIGRSLGVHLILATQKPSGQVNEQIWSNSRFKLCLKVQSQEDSNEVLKSPLAAEIKEPGRAYLQVGNNEIFELFQSAYSGAAEKSDDSNVKEFAIYEFNDSGRRVPIFSQKKQKNGEASATQLDAIVSYVSEYCNKIGLKKLPDICLPSLRTVIQYSNEYIDEFSVPVGVYDDPDNQLQETFGINVFSENTMMVGSSMMGKTNLLQLVIRGIAEKYTPNEVTMYIIDFASMVLKNFEKLNHVGGVVVSNEEEKLKNLFKMLNEEIVMRKEKLLTAGVSNFVAYKESGNKDIPQIVVLIDNLTALKELYFTEDDFLLPICRDGLSVGISVVIANSQTAGIGFKYFSNINQRVGLFCNDITEYHSLFEHCKMQPDNVPGRCLIQRDKVIYEAQTFMAFEGEKEHERVQEIARFISDINEKYRIKAKKIPVVPEILLSNMLTEEYGVTSNADKLFIGLNYANVMPVALDYARQDVLVLSGSYVDSKVAFISYLKNSFLSLDTEMYVLDDYSGTFSDLTDDDRVELYSKSVDDLAEMLSAIKNTLVERYAAREMHGKSVLNQMKPIILIINTTDAASYISENRAVLETYKEIIKKYKNLKSLILFTNIDNEQIAYSSPEVMKMMKDNYQLIMFEDLSSVKLFDCPMSLMKKFKSPLKDNEAYFLSGSTLKKIKTVLR